MTLQERIDLSETHVCTTVFPFLTNHHDTLFGGKAMSIMDEVSFMAATRFCRKTLVTFWNICTRKEENWPLRVFLHLLPLMKTDSQFQSLKAWILNKILASECGNSREIFLKL